MFRYSWHLSASECIGVALLSYHFRNFFKLSPLASPSCRVFGGLLRNRVIQFVQALKVTLCLLPFIIQIGHFWRVDLRGSYVQCYVSPQSQGNFIEYVLNEKFTQCTNSLQFCMFQVQLFQVKKSEFMAYGFSFKFKIDKFVVPTGLAQTSI